MDLMGDLTSKRWIVVKGFLFLLIGVLAGAVLLVENWSWKVLGLLVASIWGFCRSYYFAFYVIEKYVDSGYRFSGLGSFVRYWFRR